VSTSTGPRAGVRRPTPLIPPQHGAWAFLALPLALALTVAPPTWWTAVLAVAWFAAYPASYAGGRMLHDRRPERFRRAFMIWAGATAVPALILVIRFPWLLWVGAVLVALASVNVHYARRHDERALPNDLVLVTECSVLVATTWAVSVDASTTSWGGGLPVAVLVLTAVCWLVLAGSTLHVKSLVRERGDPRFARASRAVAVLSVAASVGLGVAWGLPSGWVLVVPFAALAVRAFVVGRRPTRVAVIGLIELAMFGLVVAAAWLA
jgi:YwiC-like protein